MTSPALPHVPRADAGFSLVEVLVTVALTLVVAATVFSFSRYQTRAMHDQARQVELQTTARSIVDLFAREARRAGMDPGCTKTFAAINSAKLDEVQLLADLDGSGAIDQANETVRYRIDAANRTLERMVNGTASSLTGDVGVSSTRFRYFDANGVEQVPNPSLSSAQRDALRRVRLEVTLNRAAEADSAMLLRAAAATDVSLRNRFFVAGTGCP